VSRHVIWDRRALADLSNLARADRRQADRIRDAVARYATDSRGDVLKLSGATNEYRLRVGDWRVIFRLEDGGTLAISRVLNRRDAYR
jgi:mRNA interferase RelE/StbE